MPDPVTPVAAGGSANLLSGRKVPIIFVPGVMGSRLQRPNGNGYWDPDDSSVMLPLLSASASIEGIMLDSATGAEVMTTGHSSAALTAAETNRGWGGVAWGFYGNLLRFLQPPANWGGNQVNVYACGYDWRQCNSVSGRRLSTKIDRVLAAESGAEKVILVTHSMGGLVSRAASQARSESKVAGIIHVVQPAVGAVAAYRRWKTGASSDYEDGEFGLRCILGRDAYKYARIMAGIHGPAQLMPSNDHPVTVTGRSHWLTATSDVLARHSVPTADIYDTYLETSGEVGVFRHADDGYTANKITDTIGKARRFHQRLGLYAHPNTYVVAVDGYETDVASKLMVEDGWFSSPHITVDEGDLETTRGLGKGDKTVPLVSQTALRVPTAKQHIFRGRSAPDHAEVFSSTNVNRKVLEFASSIIATM